MKVVGGGCSGFQYDLAFGESKGNDKVFEFHGLKVFVDPRSTLYLAGSTLDYQDGLMDSGFKITNPNAKTECGAANLSAYNIIKIQCGHRAEYTNVAFSSFL